MSMGEGGKGGSRDFNQELREIQESKVDIGDLLSKPRTGDDWVKLHNLLAGQEIYHGLDYSGDNEAAKKPLTYFEFKELALDTTAILDEGSREVGYLRGVVGKSVKEAIEAARKKK